MAVPHDPPATSRPSRSTTIVPLAGAPFVVTEQRISPACAFAHIGAHKKALAAMTVWVRILTCYLFSPIRGRRGLLIEIQGENQGLRASLSSSARLTL